MATQPQVTTELANPIDRRALPLLTLPNGCVLSSSLGMSLHSRRSSLRIGVLFTRTVPSGLRKPCIVQTLNSFLKVVLVDENQVRQRYGHLSTMPLLNLSVLSGPIAWRFVLGERRDGRSSLRLELVESASDPAKERIRAAFIVTSAGDFERIR